MLLVILTMRKCWNIFRRRIAKKKKKKNQNKFKVEKVIKRKGDKLYLTWKGYHNSFNSWVDKKNYIVQMSEYFPKRKFLEKHFN